jgi:hypothetical protein
VASISISWFALHHRDEAGAELEVPIAGVDSQHNGHVGNNGDGVVVEVLAMIGVADGTGVTSSSIGGVAEEEVARDRFFLSSASKFSM